MNAEITGQLWVESGGEHSALPNRNNPTGGRPIRDAAQHLNVPTDRFDPWCPDEDGVERLLGEVDVRFLTGRLLAR